MDNTKLPDVKVKIVVELASSKIHVGEILDFRSEKLIHFDTTYDTGAIVKVNGIPFALAEIVAIDDKFGVKITEILKTTEKEPNT